MNAFEAGWNAGSRRFPPAPVMAARPRGACTLAASPRPFRDGGPSAPAGVCDPGHQEGSPIVTGWPAWPRRARWRAEPATLVS